MTDISFTEWHALSDQALMARIGAFIRHHRLEGNKSQDVLAHEAGISRSTLSLLERGETVTLSTLIQVLRVLDQLQVMEAFEVRPVVSPLVMARAEQERRRRARGGKAQDPTGKEPRP